MGAHHSTTTSGVHRRQHSFRSNANVLNDQHKSSVPSSYNSYSTSSHSAASRHHRESSKSRKQSGVMNLLFGKTPSAISKHKYRRSHSRPLKEGSGGRLVLPQEGDLSFSHSSRGRSLKEVKKGHKVSYSREIDCEESSSSSGSSTSRSHSRHSSECSSHSSRSSSNSTSSSSSSYSSHDEHLENKKKPESSMNHHQQGVKRGKTVTSVGDVGMEVEVVTGKSQLTQATPPSTVPITNTNSQPLTQQQASLNTEMGDEGVQFKKRVTARDIGLRERELGRDTATKSVHTYSACLKMESELEWRKIKSMLARRIRGLELKYNCHIYLGDQAQTYGTDTVYPVRITGPSGDVVMRCRTGLPDLLLKRMITPYWNMDEEIEYGKTFTSNSSKTGLLRTGTNKPGARAANKPPTRASVPARLLKKK